MKMWIQRERTKAPRHHRRVFSFIKNAPFRATKKAPSQFWDKTSDPAVPPKLTQMRPLVSRTMIRAALVTGAGPVRGYWARGRSLCPRKSIRRNVLCRDPTIRGSLKGDRNRLLLLLTGFDLKLFTLYALGGRLSTTNPRKFFAPCPRRKPSGRLTGGGVTCYDTREFISGGT